MHIKQHNACSHTVHVCVLIGHSRLRSSAETARLEPGDDSAIYKAQDNSRKKLRAREQNTDLSLLRNMLPNGLE